MIQIVSIRFKNIKKKGKMLKNKQKMNHAINKIINDYENIKNISKKDLKFLLKLAYIDGQIQLYKDQLKK